MMIKGRIYLSSCGIQDTLKPVINDNQNRSIGDIHQQRGKVGCVESMHSLIAHNCL